MKTLITPEKTTNFAIPVVSPRVNPNTTFERDQMSEAIMYTGHNLGKPIHRKCPVCNETTEQIVCGITYAFTKPPKVISVVRIDTGVKECENCGFFMGDRIEVLEPHYVARP